MPQIFRDTDGVIYELPEGEMVHWRPSVYGYLQQDGKTLMVEDGRGKGGWELPGGGVEFDETFADALAREFYEETGYKVRITDERPLWIDSQDFYSKTYNKFFKSVLIFYAVELIDSTRNAEIVNTVMENEISAMEWVADEELTPATCHPMLHGFLKRQ